MEHPTVAGPAGMSADATTVLGAQPAADSSTVALEPGPDRLDDPLIGRILDGRYQVVRVLARGGMATVYVASDLRLDREVAVKVMHPAFAHDPDFVERFEREAKAAARISDPHVVSVYDAGTDGSGRDRVVFLVMEYVRGITLRELLRQRGRLTPARALDLLEPILRALAAAHRAGLVHRDVKPENVLLGDGGSVKVADFGLVRSMEVSLHTGPLILGTVAYLAPEQVSASAVSPATDVYAAGVCLYEMLTGAVPYAGEDPRAVAFRRLHEEVPPPSAAVAQTPRALDDLVARATAHDAGERFPDAEAFLAQVLETRPGLPYQPPPPPPSMQAGTRAGDTAALPVGDALTSVVPPSAPPPTAAPGRPAKRRPPKTPRSATFRRRRRRIVLVVVFLLLCAAATAGGWWYGSGRYVHVPRISGLSTADATKLLERNHLDVRSGAATYDDNVRAGLVASTTPAVGSRVTRGTDVVLHVSQGPQMIDVPQVQNVAVGDAEAAITRAGLHLGSTSNVYSATVAKGVVITSDPAPGSSVDHRTAITLTVSQGPAPAKLPDLHGLPQAQALALLSAAQLKAEVTQEFSDTVEKGTVIRQSPQPGTVHQGDTVTVVVSKGPQLVQVPDLGGLSGGEATSRLQGLGLRPDERDLFGSSGTVVAQSPNPNKMVAPGTTVTFYTA